MTINTNRPNSFIVDDAFFQPDWAGACWGRWARTKAAVDWSEGFGSLGWTWTTAGLVCRLCMWLFPAEKNKKEEGSTGASPVAAPMPKSVSF